MRKIVLIILTLLIVESLGTALDDPERSVALRTLANNEFEYAKEFYKASTKAVPQNLISSPVSCSSVLSMLTYGARGRTEAALRSALRFHRDDDIQKRGLRALVEELNDTPGIDLRLANKIFKSNTIRIKSDYEELIRETFNSTIQEIDFSQSEAAAKTINDWCEQQTESKIKDMVDKDDLDAGTAVILLNAVYFKGKWAPFFKKNRTRDEPFYLEDGRTFKNVSTMRNWYSYNTGSLNDIDASFIELPYQGGQVSMFIIMPRRVDGLRNVQENFAQVNLDRLLTGGNTIWLHLSLPKFQIETRIDLTTPLFELGLGEMFTSSADFSGMFEDRVLIDHAVQKAFIKVDEEGTEAAAVTDVGGRIVGGREPEFQVNHPFYYAIIKRVGDSGIVLFQGHYKDPDLSKNY